MTKALVLFEDGNGFAEAAARMLALVLGPAKCCAVSEAVACAMDYDSVVLCASVSAVSDAEWLSGKRVALLCICDDEAAVEICNLYPIKIYNANIIYNRASVRHKIPDLNDTISMALEIKMAMEQINHAPRARELRQYAEDFLLNHNTCVLATGCGERVRATPIEYSYIDGAIYILSEGGEKFANILLNPNVSIGVFDSYSGMNRLGGMQITGTADTVDIGSGEYISVLEAKKLKYESIASLPIAMNMLKISLSRIEFLWSEFRGLGYDVKQIIELK